jgi:tetratricopeptide (TPR) repeat protein
MWLKKILRQGIEAAPHATLYFTLAAYHANEHDIPKAIDYFKKGYSLDPEYATMYFFDIVIFHLIHYNFFTMKF